MHAIARTETIEQRAAILSRLVHRNRLVGILRYGVPALGLIIFAALALQLYVGNLLQQFGIARISIDRNNLIVETPSYVVMGGDGMRYAMSAASARASFGAPDLMALSDAVLDITSDGASGFHARASDATLDTGTQQMSIPGTATIAGDDGTTGTLAALIIDMRKRNATGTGPVDLRFSDGTTLKATGMSFAEAGRVWTFNQVTMRLLDTPKDDTP
jgi:lipopolysaccharide export system protein LptC